MSSMYVYSWLELVTSESGHILHNQLCVSLRPEWGTKSLEQTLER